MPRHYIRLYAAYTVKQLQIVHFVLKYRLEFQ